METKEKNIAFLKSALTTESTMMPSEGFIAWMKAKNEQVHVKINQIPFSEMRLWHFDGNTGNLVHQSGKFFSIEGIRVKTNWGKVSEWEQPIINQPEVGFLGIITKKFDGILYFLMQAKIEPGNLNVVQLSPTLQATRSNYSQVHKGKRPLYLEYFNGEKPVKILLDQLQSEQGARFLRKRNRNIIVEIAENEKIEVFENFCWLTLGQIKSFLQYDNLVNMDTRTVISGIPFGEYPPDVLDFYETLKFTSEQKTRENGLLISMLDDKRHLHDVDEIISWMTRQKAFYDLEVERIPLKSVKDWVISGDEIYHQNRKYFSVIGVHVEIGNREVQAWDQPLIKAAQEGIIAFIVKKINGIYHFLVQAKLEAGNFDIIELAPTVQCLTGNYRKGQNEYDVMFLDEALNAKPEQIWFSSYQSEEGGRFFKEQNKNMIIEAGDNFPVEVPENYIWMTLNQLKVFIKYNNYLNIAARSLIAAVKFI
ncbi:MAG: NDP-hexose 2,3-dehydratase family protein [Bacteroidales bacterium]|nr:NDP-hexose 2,3-dehydratase family protein [Bacteroidales bacterium]